MTPRRISDRLLAAVQAANEAERVRLAQMAAVHREMADGERVSDHLDENASPRELRQRAALVIRCDDCGGRIVAHVTYIKGRPMLWCLQQDGTGSRGWLDDGFWGDVAHCRVREYVLDANVLLSVLPKRAARREEIRLTH